MRKPSLLLFTLLALLALTGWAYLSQSAPVAAQSTHTSSTLGKPAPTGPVGVPAIHPRTTTAPAGTPAFTTADVEQLVKNTPMPKDMASWNPVIIRVTFLTSLQVSALLKDNTGVPDERLLCYVEMQGTFSFPTPSGTGVTFQRGFEVFDAHSGNLLMSGGLI